MSASLNKVMLIGHLGKDPEVRRTNSGSPVVSFSVATSESWKDKESGKRKERTEWHNITIFNEGLANIAEKYLKKGSKVYIEGRMSTRKYTDRDGNERWTTEVVLAAFNGSLCLLDRQEREAPSENSYGKTTSKRSPASPEEMRRSAPGAGAEAPLAEVINDDIPF